MKTKDFKEKYGLVFKGGDAEEFVFFSVLDKIYTELTKEQAVEIIKDFYDSADEIYNEMTEKVEQIVGNIKDLLDSFDDDKKDGSNNKFDA